MRAPQHGTDAGQDLAQVERFGNVIVRTGLEPGDLVDDIPLAGQHDDGGSAALSDVVGQREAVLAGQHEIEQNEIGPLTVQRRAHRGSVRGLADLEALVIQVTTQHRSDARIVIHDEDMHLRGHFRRPVRLYAAEPLLHIVTQDTKLSPVGHHPVTASP